VRSPAFWVTIKNANTVEEEAPFTIPESAYGPSSLEMEFNTLARQWKDETFFQSSLSEICFHPAYQTIMAMGKEALPFILKDLTERIDHWFYALKCIARKDVAAGSVNLEDARQRWLDWGRREKYLL
jgi:hypothetical protein